MELKQEYGCTRKNCSVAFASIITLTYFIQRCKRSNRLVQLSKNRRNLMEERPSPIFTQLKQLRKERLKKIQSWTGFEPMTSAIPVQCSTNWAIKPTGSWSLLRGSFFYLIFHPLFKYLFHIFTFSGINISKSYRMYEWSSSTWHVVVV